MIKTARQLKDLIRNLAREKSADAQILMRNYMMERFLERISLSEYRDNFSYRPQAWDGGAFERSEGSVFRSRKQPCDAGALVRLSQEIFLCG